jgi:cephalosporin hydroxylase
VAVGCGARHEVQPPVVVEVGDEHGRSAVGVAQHGLRAELLVAVVFVPQDLAVGRRGDNVDIPAAEVRGAGMKVRSSS